MFFVPDPDPLLCSSVENMLITVSIDDKDFLYLFKSLDTPYRTAYKKSVTPTKEPCFNTDKYDEYCGQWAERGLCKKGNKYYGFMNDHCRKTCKFCTGMTKSCTEICSF